MPYQLESPPVGPKPQHRKPFRMPLWLVFLMWGTAAFVAFIWLAQLKNGDGKDVLDDRLIQILIPLMALIGALLTQILQKQNAVEHEYHPNSGSTQRDAIDRTERIAREALEAAREAKANAKDAKNDTRELREDVQQLHSDLSDKRTDDNKRFDKLETGINKVVELVSKGA